MPGAKGSFSYKNDSINGFNVIVNGNAMQLRVERVNNNIASIIITDALGNAQPMPPAVTLVDNAGAPVPVRNDEFLITWIDTYTLRVAGEDVLTLTNQKQQLFSAAAGVTHFMINR